MLAIQIAEGEMREVNIFDVPGCSLSGIAADGLAEKCQFESVAMAVCGFQISRCSTTTPSESRDDRNNLEEIRIDSRAPRCGTARRAG